MKCHLEPLAVAANITQAAFCRLDQVLLTFGNLIMQYRLMTDVDDQVGCNAIINSLETRWAKLDQAVFIAAIILNPFIQSTPFAALPFLNNAGIHSLLRRLWRRFYMQEPPLELHSQIDDYLHGKGIFNNLQSHCEMKDVQAEHDVCHSLEC
jgi:hypothetical protein